MRYAVAFLFIGGTAYSYFTGVRPASNPLLWLAVALLFAAAVWFFLVWFEFKRCVGQLSVALANEDAAQTRALIEKLRAHRSSTLNIKYLIEVHEAALAMIEERFADAARIYEAMDAPPLAPHARAMFRNNTAYCLALSGDSARALELAEQAIGLGKDLPSVQQGYLQGTLGIAMWKAGDAQGGLTMIQRAMHLGGDARIQSVRHYFRGEMLRSLGRLEDARDAFQLSIGTLPGRWAARQAARGLKELGFAG